MILELFEKKAFIYIILGICAVGILIRLSLAIKYMVLIRASKKMGTSRNKLMRVLRLKFETCYKLHIGVNNVDSFVDKYVYRYRMCGILLSTWERISGVIICLCGFGSAGIAALGVVNECGQANILSTLTAGGLTAALLISFYYLMGIQTKQKMLKINIKDYLENFLKARLENETFDVELLEQYRKEFIQVKEQQSRKSNKRQRKKERKRSQEELVMTAEKESAATAIEQTKDVATLRREAKKNELKAMLQADRERHKDNDSEVKEDQFHEVGHIEEYKEFDNEKFSKQEQRDKPSEQSTIEPVPLRKKRVDHIDHQVEQENEDVEQVKKRDDNNTESRFEISKEEVKIIEDILKEYLA